MVMRPLFFFSHIKRESETSNHLLSFEEKLVLS